MPGLRHYQVVGRKEPTDSDPNPPLFRMKLFASNPVRAKSRFWYFLHQYRKMKHTTGEILAVNQIFEKNVNIVKNFGIWLRYNSRSGTHNFYKEYRDTHLTGAVEQMFAEMAGLHRARRAAIQIIRTASISAKDSKRPVIKQFHKAKIAFPLPHTIPRNSQKKFRSTFRAGRPSTYVK